LSFQNLSISNYKITNFFTSLMQERRINSAFRLSRKQSDSRKTKNSLDQLLGVHSRKTIEDYIQDSDDNIVTTQSTSTLIRRNIGPHFYPSKENNVSSYFGFEVNQGKVVNTDLSNILLSYQMELLAKFKNPLNEIALNKKPQFQSENRIASLLADEKLGKRFQNPQIQLDQTLDLIHTIFSGLIKQPTKNNLSLEPAKDESTKQKEIFYAKLQQLHNLEQQLAISQRSENQQDNRKCASHQKLTQNNHTKCDKNKMDILNRGDNNKEISSLNSLDEEIEMSTKPEIQSSSLSHGLSSQLEDLNLNTVKSETSVSNKPPNQYLTSQSLQDFSHISIQQRLELHHAKNNKYINQRDGDSEERGTGKSIPGTYTLNERIRRILHYKKKIVKWRISHPPCRNFSGRSAVAGSKPRIKGKFVKREEYQNYIEIQKKNSKI
jgi:hypothetical protein